MNKTVNINLGGMFFHIDEDAYQKMTRYFDAIKRSLSNSNGQDEIIKDIEMRIAELITEKHTSDKQVINIKELDEVIAVMGQPEDYRIDNDENDKSNTMYTNPTVRKSKKLYRDREKGMIGGVASGLGYYFGIDTVWLRIALIILVFAGFGSGIIAYIVLWIIVPEAVTTSEKLEMHGEPITISNIEKKVREEFENVSDKFKNTNFDAMGNQIKTGAQRTATHFGDFLISMFKVFAKVLGVFLIIIAIPVLVSLLISIFTLGSSAFIHYPWQDFIQSGNYTGYPIWSFGVLMFIVVGIPFFFLMLLGFKLLINNMRSIGNTAKYTLLAVWIVGIVILISIGISQATQFAIDGRVVQKSNIALQPNDTLMIRFVHNDYFANDVNDNKEFIITEDTTNTKVIYSNEVSFAVVATDEKQPYIEIEKQAKGPSLSEAKKTAEKIKYGYQFVGNQLILDNYLITDFKNKYRGQEVEIRLYLPKGTVFKADKSTRNYDRSDNSFFNLHHSSENYIYKVDADNVKCLNCPPEENEYDDVDMEYDVEDGTVNDTVVTTTTSVKVNGEGVIVKETKKTRKGLSQDENGVIIKNE